MSVWWRVRFPFSCFHFKICLSSVGKNGNKLHKLINRKKRNTCEEFYIIYILYVITWKYCIFPFKSLTFSVLNRHLFLLHTYICIYIYIHIYEISLPKRCKFAVLPCPLVEVRWGSEWFRSAWQWRLKYNHSEKGEALGLLSLKKKKMPLFIMLINNAFISSLPGN